MAESNCKAPKVSVLMITYNHINFITQAIESVLMQQTDFEYELVIGEDCSTDGTREIVKNYAEKYPDKIKTLIHPENVGMQQNFLKVLEACRGEYAALLEGDDYWADPLKLQKLVDFLDNNLDFSICFHKIKILENNELKDDYITIVPGNISTIEDLAKDNYIHTPSCMFRNRGTEILGENFLRSPVGDYYIHMMNALYGKIYYIDEPMAVYRIHENSIWSNKGSNYKQLKSLIAYICIFNDIKCKGFDSNIINCLQKTLFPFYSQICERLKFIDNLDSVFTSKNDITIIFDFYEFLCLPKLNDLYSQEYASYNFSLAIMHLRLGFKILFFKIINGHFLSKLFILK